MIYLNSSPTAASVRSFWLVVALLYAALVFLLGRLAFPSTYFALTTVGAALAFASFAAVRPAILQRTYAITSSVIRKRLVGLVRAWVVRVVFWVTIYPNRFLQDGSGESGDFRSGWLPKEIAHLIGGSEREEVAKDNPEISWLKTFLLWIGETRNWWVAGLIPFMLLLAVLDVGESRRAQPEETYTLY
jgi:hypothetical protein